VASNKTCFWYYPDDITILHTLFPFLEGTARLKGVIFTTDTQAVLSSIRAYTLVIVRMSKRKEMEHSRDVYERLRDRYKRLVFLDDVDSADEINTVAIQYAHLYFKKQLYRDKSLYQRPMYGKRLFTDYYHEKSGIEDANPATREPLSEDSITKLRLLWNLGIGSYPRSKTRNGLARRLAPTLGIRSTRVLHRRPPAAPDTGLLSDGQPWPTTAPSMTASPSTTTVSVPARSR
jgi:hypothetical protein